MLMQKNKRYFDFKTNEIFKINEIIKTNKIDSISSLSMPEFVLKYSKEQIIELFQLGKIKALLHYREYEARANKLSALGLPFNDSKYLMHTIGLSIEEIVKCVDEFKLDVDLIRKLSCSRETLLYSIPNILLLVDGVENLKTLLANCISIDDIKVLFQQFKLSYNDIVSLINCGYKGETIRSLLGEKITIEELILLAEILTATCVYSLSMEDKRFLLTIHDTLNSQINDLDSALEKYQVLYDSIPDTLCDSLIKYSISCIPPPDPPRFDPPRFDPPRFDPPRFDPPRFDPPRFDPSRFDPSRFDPPRGHDSSKSNARYEEVLMYYMDLAGGSLPLTAGFLDAVPKIIEYIERVIKHTRSSFNTDFLPIKPFVLSAIWLALDLSLEKMYIENIEQINSKVVARSILSFLTSSLCGITGYFHSGGVGLPFPNITNFIKTYYNIQMIIKKEAPKIYNNVPKWLVFDTDQSFDTLMSDRQKDASRALCMVYTFRVGNAFLCSIIGKNGVFSKETAKNIFKSLWPLPQKTESMRMYFIYGGIPVYSTLQLKDVFVLIS